VAFLCWKELGTKELGTKELGTIDRPLLQLDHFSHALSLSPPDTQPQNPGAARWDRSSHFARRRFRDMQAKELRATFLRPHVPLALPQTRPREVNY
jgi:hypothetical protein